MFILTQPFYEDDTGANGGEAADLQTDNQIDETTSDTGASEDNSGAADQKHEQSQDDNARFAAARREAENRAKVIEEEREQDAKDAGFDSYAQMQAAIRQTKKEQQEAAKQERVDQYGYDPEEVIEKKVEERLQNDPVYRNIQEQQRQQSIKNDIELLHKEFPETATIKTEEDLYKLPEWGEVLSYIQKGYDMPDAYYKVNKNKVAGTIAKNAVQRTIADIQDRSRRGVVSGGDAGNEDIDLPTLTKEGADMANAFGNDPKAIAKYVKTKLKNKE